MWMICSGLSLSSRVLFYFSARWSFHLYSPTSKLFLSLKEKICSIKKHIISQCNRHRRFLWRAVKSSKNVTFSWAHSSKLYCDHVRSFKCILNPCIITDLKMWCMLFKAWQKTGRMCQKSSQHDVCQCCNSRSTCTRQLVWVPKFNFKYLYIEATLLVSPLIVIVAEKKITS